MYYEDALANLLRTVSLQSSTIKILSNKPFLNKKKRHRNYESNKIEKGKIF